MAIHLKKSKLDSTNSLKSWSLPVGSSERQKQFELSAEIWPRHVIRHKVTPMPRKGCCGVVVITLVLHTKGPQFDPGQQHFGFCGGQS
ncbi:unnamed protein product [Dovyalis caffra]|uniref:Uncharacterized protein n=1 Tax=Dovyalis caffra TaxID=77055 RepID=A0AAV1SK28_9ROSI|nr:unnamed protein product [Dovyalis caffra]